MKNLIEWLSGTVLMLCCTADLLADPKAAKSQIVRIGNKAEPRELMPTKITGRYEAQIARNLFDPLLKGDPLSSLPRGASAESWTISPDAKIYTFKLRKNLKWSDGKALTADDFVYGFRTLVNPKTAAEYAYQAFDIVNAKEIQSGALKDLSKLGVRALDPHTFEITLKAPVAHFLMSLVLECFAPLPRHLIEKNPTADWTKPGVMVSNGPYKLSEWVINKHIKLVKNEYYWNKDQIKVTEAYFVPTENIETEHRLFMSGQLDITESVSPMKIPLLVKEKAVLKKGYHPLNISPLFGSMYLALNLERASLKDIRVRKALSLAIDQKTLVNRVLGAGQIPAASLIPRGFGDYPGYNAFDIDQSAENIKAAKKLIAEAGFPEGKGFKKLSLVYNTDEIQKKMVTAIQQMWKKNLGIEVELVNQEWKVYLNTLSKSDFDISRAGWNGDYVDPNTFLELFTSDSPMNYLYYKDAGFDNLVAKAKVTKDAQERLKVLLEAEKRLVDSFPIVPLLFDARALLVSEKLRVTNAAQENLPWRGNPLQNKILDNWVLSE